MTAVAERQYRAICRDCGWRDEKPTNDRTAAWVRLLMRHRNALHPECGEVSVEVPA